MSVKRESETVFGIYMRENVERENSNTENGVLFSNAIMTLLLHAHSRAMTRLTHRHGEQ